MCFIDGSLGTELHTLNTDGLWFFSVAPPVAKKRFLDEGQRLSSCEGTRTRVYIARDYASLVN